MTKCAVETCDREAQTRGWCQAHYMRWWHTKDVRPTDPIVSKGKPEAIRFWRLVDRRKSDECWPWIASASKGYGYFTRDGHRRTLAHRVAYELAGYEVPDGLQLDHVCHTRDLSCPGGMTCPHRRCCNPSHLEPVTSRENQVRGRGPAGARARAAAITHCPHGHEYTVENTWRDSSGHRFCRACNRNKQSERNRKLREAVGRRSQAGGLVSAAEVSELRAAKTAGASMESLAERYGVSRSTAYNVVRGIGPYANR